MADTSSNLIVRMYGKSGEYERDAQHLALYGYRVESVTEQRHRYPWWQVFVTVGLIYHLAPQHTDLVVTYERG
jgi:hypothetical protein